MPGLEGESAAERLLGDLARWAAAERARAAAAGRSRARSLADQAAASATWIGVLVDLAEIGAEVVVAAGSTRAAGRLVAVGRDFAVVEQPSGRPALVRTERAGWVSSAPGVRSELTPAPSGRRDPQLDLRLVSALELLVAERAPVSIATGSGPVEGRIQSLGDDLITLRGASGRITHVRLDAADCFELR